MLLVLNKWAKIEISYGERSTLFGTENDSDTIRNYTQIEWKRVLGLDHVSVSLTSYPIALKTAKTLWSFGLSECKRVKSNFY